MIWCEQSVRAGPLIVIALVNWLSGGVSVSFVQSRLLRHSCFLGKTRILAFCFLFRVCVNIVRFKCVIVSRALLCDFDFFPVFCTTFLFPLDIRPTADRNTANATSLYGLMKNVVSALNQVGYSLMYQKSTVLFFNIPLRSSEW